MDGARSPSTRWIAWPIVAAITAVLVPISIQWTLSTPHAGLVTQCDALFAAFDPEITNGLDGGWDSLSVATALVKAHGDIRDPRDQDLPGLVQRFDPSLPGFLGAARPRACQVLIEPSGADAVTLIQPPTPPDEGGFERKRRIAARVPGPVR